MTDWQDRYEGLAAMLLEANTILTEVGVGDHGSFVERLEALVQDCKGALEARAAEHQALMDAHRAVTRNYPTGAESEADAGRPLAERIDALARTCQRVGHAAGWVAGREGHEAAVGGLKEAYAAVAMAFPGRTEIAPEVPLAEHIQALADACYRQGHAAGWVVGRGLAQAAEDTVRYVNELSTAHCLLDAQGVPAAPLVERIRHLARALNTTECAYAVAQREDGAREQKAAYDRGRAETIAVCVAVLRRRGAMAPTEGGGIMLDDADYLERVVRP